MKDEADLTNPRSTGTATVATQRKHAAMIERLSNLNQSRLSRKSNSETSSNPPFESTQSFLSRFSESKLSIESRLSQILKNPGNPNSKFDLDNVSTSISELEKLVAENSYFLPAYEVRACLRTISDLKQTLEAVTAEVVPRKRFAFKSKATRKETNLINVIPENQIPQIQNQNAEPERTGFHVRDLPGFRGKEDEVLVKEFTGGPEETGEFTLSDLRGCEVRLMGCFRTLFVHRLRNCKIYAGPVLGSILIEEMEGCRFVLASHQIRIHLARACDFYLRVRSRPIIEDCSEVRFAPYCLVYDGIEKDLEEANLGEENGNWASVDDFRWLRAVQSPNWSVLPESERIGTVNISCSEA